MSRNDSRQSASQPSLFCFSVCFFSLDQRRKAWFCKPKKKILPFLVCDPSDCMKQKLLSLFQVGLLCCLKDTVFDNVIALQIVRMRLGFVEVHWNINSLHSETTIYKHNFFCFAPITQGRLNRKFLMSIMYKLHCLSQKVKIKLLTLVFKYI